MSPPVSHGPRLGRSSVGPSSYGHLGYVRLYGKKNRYIILVIIDSSLDGPKSVLCLTRRRLPSRTLSADYLLLRYAGGKGRPI